MSAIWGVVNLTEPVSCSFAEKLEISYKKYNIDRFEHVSLSHAYLGCGHQYLMPTSQNEILPYYDKERKILFTADAVLDNREELLHTLKIGHSSLPDGALLYHAYLEYGQSFPSYCLGAYTVAVYHEIEQRVYLFTDHMCNRSLFYTIQNKQLIFSTLLPPFFSLFEAKTNEKWYSACLATTSADMMLFEHLTPMDGVMQAPATTVLTFDSHGLRKREYWSPMRIKPNYAPKHKKFVNTAERDAYYQDYYTQTLSQAVSSMLGTEGKIGCTLSSGLDSTSIAAFAASSLSLQNKKLYSFTSLPLPDYLPDKEDTYAIIDESHGVKELCNMYPNIEPTYIRCIGLSPFSSLKDLIPLIGYPMKSGQNLTWLNEIYKYASKLGCKVILKGQYGNSTISYGPALGTIYQLITSLKLRTAFKTMTGFSMRYKVPRKTLFWLLIKERIKLAFPQKPDFTNPLLSQALILKHRISSSIRKLNKKNGGGQLDTRKGRLRFVWNPLALQQLGMFDTAMGLIYGFIIRDPSKDKRVVEMCCRMPVEYDLAGFLERGKARVFMAGRIPDSIRLDINHRGLQSADYEYRCHLMWEEQKEEIFNTLDSPFLRKYLDEKQLQNFIESLKQKANSEITMDEFRLVNVLCATVIQLNSMETVSTE